MQLKLGELIVRDDTRYPHGALVVDNHDKKGNLTDYLPGGRSELTMPPDQLGYDPARDAVIGSSENRNEVWQSQLIDLQDGGQTKVYVIGAASWMWEPVEKGGGLWD